MKVLNVSETTQGGIETYFESLSRSSQVDNHFLAIGYERSDVAIKPSKFRPFNVLVLFYIVIFKLGIKQYDVLFLHSTFSGLLRPLIYPIAKYHNVRLCYCSHGWAFDIEYEQQWKNTIYRNIYIAVERILAIFCDQIYCISRYEYNSAIEIGIQSRKLKLVWNGVRPSNQVSVISRSSDQINLLFVGRLDKQKGLHIFLQTLEAIDLAGCNVVLTVIGEPVRNDCPELDILLAKPWAGLQINRLGWVANQELDRFFAQSDLVIVPSLWEGFGLIVAESLRNGTPVLASKVGSLAHMISDAVGWLYDLEDEDSLKRVLHKIIAEKAYLHIDRSQCVTHFEDNFHEDVMNQTYARSFSELR
ncbi:glycosyltransferase [Vibrio sinensis]|uniref:Glycosyltransferase n=1 Tax=Vibrio sinensis TaxID=2302434 RepID=A0A3A6QBN4_9VIBR|nr:glycosyltransferase family 4 protein [Vibrio sinensis]RJX69707.1 glycosyltransferase [Vibrio sinensis]